MKLGEQLRALDDRGWPDPIKARAKELAVAHHTFNVNKKKLDGLEMLDQSRPALMQECGRNLQRLAECYKALAAELAYYQTHTLERS